MLAGELERAWRVLAGGSVTLASCGERLGPAEVRARRPDEHPVAFLDFNRAREVLVGLLVAAERCSEQPQVGARVRAAG